MQGPPRFEVVGNRATIIGDTTKLLGDNVDSDEIIDVFYDKAPVILKKIDPAYPDLAQQSKVSGTVQIKAFVSKEGTVQRALVLRSTDTAFNQPALSSSMEWLFEPASMGNRPLGVWVGLTFHFRIVNGNKPQVESNMGG